MKAQFENEVMTSLMLYVDHYIMEKGQAYTNNNSSFYKIDEDYTDYQVWAAPYKQLVCDHSVNGASVISGAYINGSASYTTPSEGPSYQDMEFVNQYQGQIYFKANPSITPINAVSGSYSVKDFNVYLTNENEEELLFETQFDLRPKVSQTPTGLASEKQTFPAVFIKNNGGTNEPFAFGGMDNTILNARMIALADSAFNLDAVCSILKDRAHHQIPVLTAGTLPFNALGGLKEDCFNYTGLVATGAASHMYIANAYVSKVSPNRQFYKNVNKDVFSAFIDFELEQPRYPRS